MGLADLDRGTFFDDLHTRMLQSSQAEKAALIFGALQRWGEDVPTFLRLVGTRTYDPGAFVMAFERLLHVDPGNVRALKALAWHYRREGDFVTTRAYLRAMLAVVPHKAAVKLDIFRNELMAAIQSADADLSLDLDALPNPLALASYRYQVALVQGHPDPTSLRGLLVRDLSAVAGGVVRSSFDQGAGHHRPFQEAWWSILRTMLGATSIALVGNGSSVVGAGLGPAIDAHDLVVRFNFPNLLDHRSDVGTKTDLMAFAQSLVDQLPTAVGREPAYRQVPLLAMHPLGCAGTPEMIEAANGVPFAGLPQLLGQSLRSLAYETPTTGLMMLLVIMTMCPKPVSLFGFDFYSNEARPHYFPNHGLVFLGHDVHYERFFVERVVMGLMAHR